MKLPAWLTAAAPDLRAYGHLIQLCADAGHLAAGRQLHARLLLLSVTPSNFLASKLISLYSRSGRLPDARKVFDAIPNPSLFSWNALLIALSLHSPDPAAALRLFAASSAALALSPDADAVTVSALLKSLASPDLPPLAAGELHAFAFSRGLAADLFVSNGLITGYANTGDVLSARNVFDEMTQSDIVSWNAMISAYTSAGCYQECLELYGALVQAAACGVSPNSVTVASVLHACAQLKAFACGVAVHRLAVDSGIKMDVAAWNSMVGFYAKCGRLVYARKLFERMVEKDAVSYIAMIAGYMSHGVVNEAVELFRQMGSPNVSLWNAVIAGLVQNGHQDRALGLASEMIGSGIIPNSATLSSILPSVSFFSDLLGAKQVHGYAIRNDYDQSVYVMTALIDAYAKAGFLDGARKVFELTENRSVIIWTSIISALAAHGEVADALALFNRMLDSGTCPDTVTFTAVLTACAHSGEVAEARQVFDSMLSVFSISPVMEQYACVVAALSRAGMLKDAIEFIEKMPFEPNAKVWGALLNGAAVFGDVELGRFVFHRLLEIEPENTGNYIVMANLYSNAGKWEEAKMTREKLKGIGLEKIPGCSWIEVSDGLQVFVARDTLNKRAEEIYLVLDGLVRLMREEDCAANYELDEGMDQ